MIAIRIDKRYCGPPNSGNGGYVCGRLAEHIPGDAEVMLHAPPPLDKLLEVALADDGSCELRDGTTRIATGRPAQLRLTSFETAAFEAAREAEQQTPMTPHTHPLPTCFVCGPSRMQGDGLRISAGPLLCRVAGAPAVLAATWMPDASLAAVDGLVASEFLWSALDCPTGYAASYDQDSGSFDPTPILLGRMAASVRARPGIGERCVITSWAVERNGRKRLAEAALHGEAGQLLAVARTTWIAVGRDVQLGRA